MSRKGQAAVKKLLGQGTGDFFRNGYRPHRDVGRGQPLGHCDHIRHDIPVLDGKPLSGSAKPRHHLIGDKKDVILITYLP